MIHDVEGSVRTLCLDLDTSKAQKSVVDADAQRLGALLNEAGLNYVEDTSPSGGRHLYIPLNQSLTAGAARELVEALTFHASSLDPSPHQNITDGCIRVPGSLHKSGGHQRLITPLSAAYDILKRRNPSNAVEQLRCLLAPELHRLQIKHRRARNNNVRLVTGTTPEQRTPVGRLGQGSALRTVALTGVYDQERYSSDSEARMAVLNHFAACHWSLDQVTAGMNDQFAGLSALYGTKANRLLSTEWAKAHSWVTQKAPTPLARNNTDRINDTSPTKPTGGARDLSSPGIHQLVNDLENVLYSVLDHRLKTYGRLGTSLRFLIRAVLAYMRTNQTDMLDVGCRTFAIALGKDQATIARLLPRLEQVSSGILARTARGRGRNADTYTVQLPTQFQQLARDLTWRKGKIHALRPVFRVLGDLSALAYEAIERGRETPTTADLVRSTGFSRSALTEALAHMQQLRMIERHHDRWQIIASTGLISLADRLGATVQRQEQITRYRKERAAWHAYLDRHTTDRIHENDLYDWEAEEYWIPPADSDHALQHSLWNAA